MPADNLTLASSIVGEQAPVPSLDVRQASALKFLSRAGIAELVLAALPAADEEPIGATAIHQAIGIGSRLTVKHLLVHAEVAGIATSTLVPKWGVTSHRLYRRAAAVPDDDFQNATLVYGDGEP